MKMSVTMTMMRERMTMIEISSSPSGHGRQWKRSRHDNNDKKKRSCIFRTCVIRAKQAQHVTRQAKLQSVENMPGPGYRRKGIGGNIMMRPGGFMDSLQEVMNVDFTFGRQLVSDPLSVIDSLDKEYVHNCCVRCGFGFGFGFGFFFFGRILTAS